MVTLGVGIAGSGQKNRAAYAAFGSLGTPRRCPTSVWNAVRLQRGTASAITLEHCPPSAWSRVRHRVEYAASRKPYLLLGVLPAQLQPGVEP